MRVLDKRHMLESDIAVKCSSMDLTRARGMSVNLLPRALICGSGREVRASNCDSKKFFY